MTSGSAFCIEQSSSPAVRTSRRPPRHLLTKPAMNKDRDHRRINGIQETFSVRSHLENKEDNGKQDTGASRSKKYIHGPVDYSYGYRGFSTVSSFPFKSGSSFCPSPQGSFYSVAQFLDSKRSFSSSETSEHTGVFGARNSSELVESHKTSVYEDSSESEASEESSYGSFSSMNKPHKANDARWVAIRAVGARNNGVFELKNFRIFKRLGGGDIGTVHLAELIGTRTLFAVKVMDKCVLMERKKTLRAQTEREILQSLDHPFLPTLYTHFETRNYSFLVMEFCPGGDLHSLRQKQPGKFFPEHAARFYLAEVLLALEYLHMLGIIYRDLKPENVLVREDGHIMLSDFDLSLRCASIPTMVRSSNHKLESKSSVNFCVDPSRVIRTTCFSSRFLSKPKKQAPPLKMDISDETNVLLELIAEPTNARSMSFVGTHEYLAPEIIKGEGHGSAVDWWTFGIFLYELLYGLTPFRGNGNRATLLNVIGQPLRFSESPTVSFAARDLIRGLLVKEPQHRLGYRRGAAEIKQHPFFQNVNWALIRCTTPPDVPDPFDRSEAGPEHKAAFTEEVEHAEMTQSRGDFVQVDFF